MNWPARTRGELLAALLIVLIALGVTPDSRAEEQWVLLERHPHDSDSFTQGLVIANNRIYESSGRYGLSWLEYRPLPGRIARPAGNSDGQPPPDRLRRRIDRRWFAEGLTLFNDQLYLLTWRAGRVLVLDPDTLEIRRQHRYSGEGWGLTHNNRHLIMSDGSDQLRFIDPASFEERYRLQVTEAGRPVGRLNELEWMDGWLLANIWHSDDVAIIDPVSGEVVARLQLGALYPPARRDARADVLNGLAVDPRDGSLWVTGKLWPEMYRLRVRLPDASVRAGGPIRSTER